MRINNIVLYNFGSYVGENIFDTKTDEDKNIILVGGKNGAGKTTLFTAMRLCLYGHMSFGYQNINSYYNRSVTKLINSSAKMKKPTPASVTMQIALNNGQELDYYELCRSWILSDSLTETFTVLKNGECMNDEEISDFQNYLLSLIPPELFNLYFFDGEKIADFFMDEGSNTRIKDAFLTLCGYDTFDIMKKNFKRINTSDDSATVAYDKYEELQNKFYSIKADCEDAEAELAECKDKILNCTADISALEKAYSNSGGISEDEWNSKLLSLKEEEKRRENLNALLKKWANDVIPFIMIRDKIVAVKDQIEKENQNLKCKNFCEIADSDVVKNILKSETTIDELKKAVLEYFGGAEIQILDLSLEQSTSLLVIINDILNFEMDNISKFKRTIKRSLAKTAKLRQELENSSIEDVKSYMQQRAQLFEEKSRLFDMQISIEQRLVSLKEIFAVTESELLKARTELEAELKKASINNISSKAIVMLDDLQKILYRKKIKEVEKFFKKEIKTLMRKTAFIDDISIDDSFNIRIYRNELFNSSKIIDLISTNSEDQIVNMIGTAAVQHIKKASETETLQDSVSYFNKNNVEITIPVELDRGRFSNGEKQVFIMALYHSLIQLCKYEIPFIIDTPFARIDTEHRNNISKYFFSKLNGQVFILSTNEEIDTEHVKIMKDKISATYMLENVDNKQTTIVNNTYFED